MGVDHYFALASLPRPSAPAKKSISRVCCVLIVTVAGRAGERELVRMRKLLYFLTCDGGHSGQSQCGVILGMAHSVEPLLDVDILTRHLFPSLRERQGKTEC